MCKSCETAKPAEVTTVHVWEAQGLGVAPFECIDCFVRWDNCEACGTNIKYNFVIRDAAGKTFRVGSDCVEKTGDAGLVSVVGPLKKALVKKAAKEARKAKARAAFEESLCKTARGEITVQRLGEPITFVSPYTDAEALEKLEALDYSKFAVSLLQDLEKWGRLFPRQLDWAHKLVVDSEKPKPVKPAPVALDGSWTSIEELFAKAAANLKWPKITFEVDGLTVQLSRAGDRARVPGSINVTDGKRYGENRWFGRVVKGEFQPSKDADCDRVAAFLKLFADDPAGVASEYGKRTGCCCFCTLPLTDPRSLHMGYGAKCAKNYDLPYVSIKEYKALPAEVRARYEATDAGEAVAEHEAKGDEGKYDDSLTFDGVG